VALALSRPLNGLGEESAPKGVADQMKVLAALGAQGAAGSCSMGIEVP